MGVRGSRLRPRRQQQAYYGGPALLAGKVQRRLALHCAKAWAGGVGGRGRGLSQGGAAHAGGTACSAAPSPRPAGPCSPLGAEGFAPAASSAAAAWAARAGSALPHAKYSGEQAQLSRWLGSAPAASSGATFSGQFWAAPISAEPPISSNTTAAPLSSSRRSSSGSCGGPVGEQQRAGQGCSAIRRGPPAPAASLHTPCADAHLRMQIT